MHDSLERAAALTGVTTHTATCNRSIPDVLNALKAHHPREHRGLGVGRRPCGLEGENGVVGLSSVVCPDFVDLSVPPIRVLTRQQQGNDHLPHKMVVLHECAA